MNSKQYYSELAKVTKQAAKSAVGDVARTITGINDFIDRSFDYRTGDKLKARIQKLAEKGMTSEKFAEKAGEILDKAFVPKSNIERVTGVKDLSKRTDLTEAELLRSVMKEREKAATGARRATVDKIIASQKVAQNVLDDMPPATRGKMIASLKRIAAAKTDAARDKALDKFNEYAPQVLEAYNKRLAVADYRNAEKS